MNLAEPGCFVEVNTRYIHVEVLNSSNYCDIILGLYKKFGAHGLRHCTPSRKVAGSIPDGVIGIFHGHNSSSRTMTLGSTQPLTEMCTKNTSWGLKAAGA
jgi:hypothetical protein